jgi:hypothetical protein
MKTIFVTGSSRSGTTMMSRILNNHSLIFTFNELHFFEQLCEPSKLTEIISYNDAVKLCDKLIGVQEDGYLLYKNKKKYFDSAEQIVKAIPENERTPIKIFQNFLEYIVIKNGKQYACEQTPRNALYIGDILANFPDAKIIYMVRDPRSVLLSHKYKWKRKFLGANKITLIEAIRSYFIYHPYTTSKFWVAAARESVKWQDHKNVMFIRFEDLVENPDKLIKDMCHFLSINFEPQMLEIPHVGSSLKTDQKTVVTGISNSSKDTWKKGGLTKSEVYICQKICGEYMHQFGYKEENLSIPYFSYFTQTLSFAFKMSIAVPLNLYRAKNFVHAIRKRL